MTQKPMKIGILQTGDTPEELKDQHGGYDKMFVNLLGQNHMEFDFRVYRVLDQKFPDDAQSCEGWLITGSKFSAYGPEAWIPPLKEFIRKIVKANLPLVGICFGHQIIAEALGGRVEKSEKGWGLGLDTYRLASDWTKTPHAPLTLNIFHQDQVVVLPEGAKVYASSDFCEYAGLVIGDRIMTIQGHPEFKTDYNRHLLEARRSVIEPESLIEEAIENIEQNQARIDSARFANWIGDFFTANRPTRDK